MAQFQISRLLHSFLTWMSSWTDKSSPEPEQEQLMECQAVQRIECPEILTRVLLYKRWRDSEGQVTPEAFLLLPKDKGRLSVYRQSRVSVADCQATFNSHYGSVSLHTGRVRTLNDVHELGIDVVADELPTDPCPGHSSIINLPAAGCWSLDLYWSGHTDHLDLSYATNPGS